MNFFLPDSFFIALTLGVPLALVVTWCIPMLRPVTHHLLPAAPLPGLALALLGSDGATLSLSYMVLGSVFGIGSITRVFLGFTAVLWIAAAIHAQGYLADDPARDRFELLWLVTLTGNLGLLVSLDVASFYLFFAVMTFAAYGLVIHERNAESLYAGRIYLIMAVLGEGLILAGLLMAASANRVISPFVPLLADLPAAILISSQQDLIIAFLWLGFGIKAGLPLLHMWLPLAHPVAPIPASAVLSGAMIKAGVLAWMLLLPLGLVHAPLWGSVITITGITMAFAAAFIGVQQHREKTVLAYSSISQIGFITVAIGAALYDPALWSLLAPIATLYALHHGLVKGALFLGVAVAHHPGPSIRPLLWVGLALPGLALAGLLPGGMHIKLGLKETLALAHDVPDWWSTLPLLLGVATIGTTALIARYLWLLRTPRDTTYAPALVWVGWLFALGAAMVAPFVLPIVEWGGKSPATAQDVMNLIWPPLTGIALAWLAWKVPLRTLPIPAGDVLVLFERAAQGLRRGGTLLAHAFKNRQAGFMLRFKRWLNRRLFQDSGISAMLERMWRRETVLSLLAIVLAFALVTLAPYFMGT